MVVLITYWSNNVVNYVQQILHEVLLWCIFSIDQFIITNM